MKTICEDCLKSPKSIDFIIKHAGMLGNTAKFCNRCNRHSKYVVEIDTLIEFITTLVYKEYVFDADLEQKLEIFDFLEDKELAKKYAEAYNCYNEMSIDYADQQTEDNLDTLGPNPLEETINITEIIQEKYGIDIDEVNHLYFYNHPYKNTNNIFEELFESNEFINIIRHTISEDETSGVLYGVLNPDQLLWLAKQADKFEIYLWDNFVKHVKYSGRYFLERDKTIKSMLDNFTKILQACAHINIDEFSVYRARIENIYCKAIVDAPHKELNRTPCNHSKYNRFSPAGISYSYASTCINTAIREVRPKENDLVFVGEFKIPKDAKVIDFSSEALFELSNKSSQKYNKLIASNLAFIEKFIAEIGKPIDNDSQNIEYVPTQILAELIKVEGYDALYFSSSITNQKNIVFFKDLQHFTGFKQYSMKLMFDTSD